MTKKQIDKAIAFIDNKFANMTMDEAQNYFAGDGFYSILEEAIGSAFDNPDEAAEWWYSSDPMAGKDYAKIHDHYIVEHGKMWKRLNPEQYETNEPLATVKSLLQAAKQHFKHYPNGTIELNYYKPIAASGEIGTWCYDYKTFAFELKYAMSQDARIVSIIFKY